MTAEVCLMNRLAIVIAADSATTVTHWTERGSEQRYFKGANKIFQLSDHHPVGLMIFDSADILRVPWEIVVKAFRHELGKKSFNKLSEYAAEFFSFLEKSPHLSPQRFKSRFSWMQRDPQQCASRFEQRPQANRPTTGWLKLIPWSPRGAPSSTQSNCHPISIRHI
jgi:hypothetical protein